MLCSAVLPYYTNVYLQSKTGMSALMFAAQKGSAECMRLLLAKGASKDLCDQDGQTAGDMAASEECRQLAGGTSGPSGYIRQVQAVFAEKKWHHSEVKSDGNSERITLSFNQEAPVTTQQIGCSITRRVGLVIHSTCAYRVPEGQRANVADLMARCNSDLHGKQIGNFEMDFRDGELRFKTSVNFGQTSDIKDYVRLFMKVQLQDYYVAFVGGAIRVANGSTIQEAQQFFKTKCDL